MPRTHRHASARRPGRLAAIVRLLRRSHGLHHTPRGGDPIPTGPQPVPFGHIRKRMFVDSPEVRYVPVQQPYTRQPGSHPYPSHAMTMYDMPVVRTRPYVPAERAK